MPSAKKAKGMVIFVCKTLCYSVNDVQCQQRSCADTGEPAAAGRCQYGVKTKSQQKKDRSTLDADCYHERYYHDQPKISVQADRGQTSDNQNVGIADRVHQAGPKAK